MTTRGRAGERPPRSAWRALVGLAIVLAGCSSPRSVPEPSPSPSAVSRPSPVVESPRPERSGVVATEPVEPMEQVRGLAPTIREGSPAALFALARVAADHANDERVRAEVTRVTEGQEYPYFVSLFVASMKDAREISPVITDAAAAVGRRPDSEAWLGLIREVSNQECCMAPRFLAAALEGLVEGLEETGAAPWVQVEAAMRLATLAEHSDEKLSQAATRAGTYFTMPAGR